MKKKLQSRPKVLHWLKVKTEGGREGGGKGGREGREGRKSSSERDIADLDLEDYKLISFF